MCVAYFALGVRPGYPLVLIHNRDEFYGRPTEGAHLFGAGPVLAGRDGSAGGTWLALGPRGRVAFVTNIRRPRSEGRPEGLLSRGDLPLAFLEGAHDPVSFLEALHLRRAEYGPFNIVCIDGGSAAYYGSAEGRVRPLGPGIYGLSNALLDSPWPKVVGGKEAFSQRLGTHGPLAEGSLLDAMGDGRIPPDDALPDTGVGMEWERTLGAIFVAGEIYGTRTTTLVALGARGERLLRERTWATVGAEGGPREIVYRFGGALTSGC